MRIRLSVFYPLKSSFLTNPVDYNAYSIILVAPFAIYFNIFTFNK